SAEDFIPRMVACCPWLTECNGKVSSTPYARITCPLQLTLLFYAGTVITAEHISQAWDLFLQMLQEQHSATNRDTFRHLLHILHSPNEWAAIRCSAAALAQVVAA